MSSRIVVVGSCMIDFTSYAPRLPKEGETVHGSKFATTFGGKGANQCVAAAKLGAHAILVARVGDDVWGEKYIQNLRDLNVNTDFVKTTPSSSSGIAQINVAESGSNQIVVIAAANEKLSVEDVEQAREAVSDAAVVVCQLETSPQVAMKAIQLSKGTTILNGAPALANCDPQLLALPSIFCVNESEAEVFAGQPVRSVEDAKTAVRILQEKGCNTVILTLGSQGAVLATKGDADAEHVPVRAVKCVDSTGAGDAFIGALAYLLASRKDLSVKECVGAANYVAANSVTKRGTQSSFPERSILEEYFKTE